MKAARLFFLGVALAGAAAPAAAQRQRDVLGSPVRLQLPDGPRLGGELLAVQPDSMWIMVKGAGRAIPLAGLRTVQVRRRGLDAGAILTWTAVGGAVTGAVLAAACASVASEGDISCNSIFVSTLVVWGVFGGGVALLAGSPHRQLPPEPAVLAPYARFPQGLPRGFLVDSLQGPP
jgi:hypothetical protein